jgi:DNA-binding MarR family transcriptional regulator
MMNLIWRSKVQTEILSKLSSVAAKVRLLRTWQEVHSVGRPKYSEREMMILELLKEFPGVPVTETTLSKMFAISPSSTNVLVKELSGKGLLERELGEKEATRGRPLRLTKEGTTELEVFRKSAGARFAYMFSEISDEGEWKIIGKLLEKMDRAITRTVEHQVFDLW